MKYCVLILLGMVVALIGNTFLAADGNNVLVAKGKAALVTNGNAGLSTNGKNVLVPNQNSVLSANGKAALVPNQSTGLSANGKAALAPHQRTGLSTNGAAALAPHQNAVLSTKGKTDFAFHHNAVLSANGKTGVDSDPSASSSSKGKAVSAPPIADTALTADEKTELASYENSILSADESNVLPAKNLTSKKHKVTSNESTVLNAPDLMEVYFQALKYDPVYQKALATRFAQGELLPQQVAALLPQVGITANTGWGRNLTLLAKPPAAVPAGLTTFNTKAWLVTVTQPIINVTNWFATSQATAVDKQANATLLSASEDLIVRVARAYLDVLHAKDDLKYYIQEREANAKQVAIAKKRYELGIDILTTIYNAQASYDIAIAQVIVAENTLRNSLINLSLLTGLSYSCIAPLKEQLHLSHPVPNDPKLWAVAASEHNWDLIAARYGVVAAREHVKLAFANHYPVVSLVGTYGPNYGQSQGLVNTVNDTVALQMTMPVFEGGLVLSQTRQAKDQLLGAYADMKNQYLIATTNAQERFNDVVTGIKNIEADHKTVDSSSKSLKSTEDAFRFGTRSIFDVLIAQRQLYAAERQLATDTYAYLLNTILLKQASGTLCVNDLNYLNYYLH